MGERSFLATAAQLATLLAVGLGIYFVVDNQDLVKRQQAATVAAMNDLTGEVRRLRQDLARLAQRAPSPAPGEMEKTNPDKTNQPVGFFSGKTGTSYFANQEFRDPNAEDGGRRITYTSDLPGNLNYIVTNESMLSDLTGMINDSLAVRHRLDPQRFVPVLAESWERSTDGLTFTIRLRSNATWQGCTDPTTGQPIAARPVTADDFVFFWEVVQNPKIQCDPLRTYLEKVKTIEAVDPHTVRVIWKEPYSLAEETTLTLSPLPRHYYQPDPKLTPDQFAEQFNSSERNQWLIGCGPYRLVKWDKAAQVVLERNEDYYGPRPAIRHLQIKVIKDPEKALLEFKNGNLDRIGLYPHQWVNGTPAPDFLVVTPDSQTVGEDSAKFAALKQAGTAPTAHHWEKFQYPRFNYYYIGYNMRQPIFKDKRVRQALTMLVDRQRILKEVYYGFGEVISGPFPPRSIYYDHTIEPWPFDLEKAKALLKTAGWTDSDGDGWLDKDLNGDGKPERFAFTFMTVANNSLQEKFVPIIQEDMAKAGIKFDVKPAEWSVYIEALDARKFDVCSLGWIGGIEEDPFQIWHSSQSETPKGSNHVGYISAEADRIIEEGRRTLDVAKRVELYKKFHQLLHEDQPYTFMLSPMALVTQDKRYRNARVFWSGMDGDLMWVPKAEQKRISE